jgi:hypothetical protein
MVALREFHYVEVALKPGDSFVATPVDADYLARTGKARDELNNVPAGIEKQVEEQVEEQAEPVRRRGRPRKNTQ